MSKVLKPPSTAVGNRRLLKLAEFLEKLPRKRFNFSTFIGRDWQGAQDLSCGTTACALGWAATMPEFRRLGLRIGYVRDGGGTVHLKGARPTTWHAETDAALTVFGVSDDDNNDGDGSSFDKLFVPGYVLGHYATPKQVARNIRRFVKERERKERERNGD